MAEIRKRRRKKSHADKKIALRVRQVSVAVGGIIILTAMTLWLTGYLKPIGTDDYTGNNAKMNPALVDPALQTSAADAKIAATGKNSENAADSGNGDTDNTNSNTDNDGTSPGTGNENITDGGTPAGNTSTENKDTDTTNKTGTANTTKETTPTKATQTTTSATPEPQNQSTTTPPDTDTTIEDNAIPVSKDWLEVRIQANINEIDSQDLQDFRRIIAYLDQAYVGSLTKDGLEADEQKILLAHLHSRLSDADYGKSKALFYTYSYLLEE